MGRIRFRNLVPFCFMRGFGHLLGKSIAMQEGREETDKAPTISSRPPHTLPTLFLFPSTVWQKTYIR
jgi:hypothetical protein